MKRIFFVVWLFNFALAINAWSSEAKKIKVNSAQPKVAGVTLDSMGYPTNAAIAYAQGQANARRDLTNGLMVIKTAGFPSPEAFSYEDLLERRYGVHTDWLDGCCVSAGVVQYMKGYDEIACAYIQQKYGTNIFGKLENEARTNILKSVEAESHTYTVASGDTLTKIAHKYHVTLKALENINPGINPDKLQFGQKIALPQKKVVEVPKKPKATN